MDVGGGYGVKVIDYSTGSLTETSNTAISIGDVLANPSSFEGKQLKISGTVTNITSLQGHGTLAELTDNSGSMWVFLGNNTASMDTPLTVTGLLISGFEPPVLDITGTDQSASQGNYNIQSVKLEVYQNGYKIGSGTAEYLEGKSGAGTFPMVQSSMTGTEVYVIFQRLGGSIISQGAIAKTNDVYIPLTLQIKPAIDFVWIGIILFAIGIILIMAVKTRSKGE